MRVLHVITAFQLGGAEKVVVDLTVHHARSGHEPAVVAVRGARNRDDPMGPHYRKILLDHGIRVFELGGGPSYQHLVPLPFRLARLIGEWSPHLVHSHTDVPDFVVSTARRVRRFPIVRTIHNTSLWNVHRVAGFAVERNFVDDLVIGVSHAALGAYAKLRARYRLRPSCHQQVILNGISIPPAAAANGAGRRQVGDGRPLRVAFFGRFHPEKGLEVLLDALAFGGRDALLPIEVSIFSDAAHNGEFRMRAAASPYPIALQPPVVNAQERMADFDLVIVPSWVEGFGLVALEALAARTPVLATDIAGLREALPKDWPLLVPPGNPERLHDMLCAIVAGRFDLSALADQGRAHASNYSAERCAEAYAGAYEGYMQRDGSHEVAASVASGGGQAA